MQVGKRIWSLLLVAALIFSMSTGGSLTAYAEGELDSTPPGTGTDITGADNNSDPSNEGGTSGETTTSSGKDESSNEDGPGGESTDGETGPPTAGDTIDADEHELDKTASDADNATEPGIQSFTPAADASVRTLETQLFTTSSTTDYKIVDDGTSDGNTTFDWTEIGALNSRIQAGDTITIDATTSPASPVTLSLPDGSTVTGQSGISYVDLKISAAGDLTINNLDITGYDNSGSIEMSDLKATLTAEGDCMVSTLNGAGYGLSCAGNLTIAGGGAIYIRNDGDPNQGGAALRMNNTWSSTLTINNSAVTVIGGDTDGVYFPREGEIVIADSVTFEVSGDEAISLGGGTTHEISVGSGATLNATSSGIAGISPSQGNLILAGEGAINATGRTSGIDVGSYVLTLMDTVTVTAKASSFSYGLGFQPGGKAALTGAGQTLTVYNKGLTLDIPLSMPATGYEWDLLGGALSYGSLTDKDITYTLAEDFETERIAVIKLLSTGPARTDVCEIGAKGYATLDAALADVPAGALSATTIKLLDDIKYTSGLLIENKNIIFDLNRHDLEVTKTYVSGSKDPALKLVDSEISYAGKGSFTVTSVNTYGLDMNRSECRLTGVTTNADGYLDAMSIRDHSEVIIDGDVVLTGTANICVAITAMNESHVAVNGNVTSTNNVAHAGGGSTIMINGNSTSSGTYTHLINPIIAGSDCQIIISGNATGGLRGVLADNQGGTSGNVTTINVGGNVTAVSAEANRTGAEARNGAQVTIGGAILGNPPNYIVLDNVTLEATDKTTPTTKVGYDTYTTVARNSTVWVKSATGPAIAVSSTGLSGLKVGQAVSGSITYTLSSGAYATPITPANFAVSGLPAGLSAAAATRTSDTVVMVAITGSPTTYNASATALTLPASIPKANVTGAVADITPSGSATASAVAKGDGAAVSGAPTVSGTPTQNRIIVNAVTNAGTTGQSVEYAISTTSGSTPATGWQPDTTFNSLTAGTTYYVYARTASSSNYDAGTAQRSEAIATAAITNAPLINGSAAGTDTINLTYGYTSGNTKTYTVTGAPVPAQSASGVVGATFTGGVLTIPIGLDVSGSPYTVILTASSTAGTATMTVTVNVAKAAGAAVSGAPVVSGSPTTSSITVTAVTNAGTTGQSVEYAISTTSGSTPAAGWQAATTFNSLAAGTTYYVYARTASNANYNAGPARQSAIITTDKSMLSGAVTISGAAKYGEQLTAVTTGLSSTPASALGTLSYQWKRGAANIGTNAAEYTLAQADIGETITVTVTAANCSGEVTSAATAMVTKADGPAAPSAPTAAGITANTITLTAIAGAEYKQGAAGAWQDSAAFSGLTPNTGYTFYARIKETAVSDASPESAASAAITTLKLAQTAPAAPTMAGKDATSITLTAIAGAEYKQGAAGAWQTSPLFTGLTPNTGYIFFARLAGDAAHEPSTESAASATITTDKAALGGTVTVSGAAKYGEQLTAVTTGLSSTPAGALGTLSYQWKRGTTNIGTNNAAYTLAQADIGQTITVTVTAANCSGEVTSVETAMVTKADGPAAPSVTGSYTGNGTTFTYTVTAIAGAEYSKDGSDWQNSNVFTGFTTATPATTFYARIKGTATHTAGSAGNTGPVTFAKLNDRAAPPLNFTISDGAFPKTVTIITVMNAEYSFNSGAWSAVNTYTSNAAEDVTLAIRLVENDTHNASLPSAGTVNTDKRSQNPPPVFTLQVTAVGDTNYTVTIPATQGAEYSFDGTTWGNTNTKTGCLPGDAVTGYKRMAETATQNVSGAVSNSVTLPLFKVQTPTATPNGGNFATSQSVTLSCATTGAAIYYTLDGSTPDTSSTPYIVAFDLTDTTTVKAVAVKAGMTNSEMLTITFTKTAPATHYTITFNANGGSVSTATMQTGADGKLASLPTPTRSGSYSFGGWFTASSSGAQITTGTVFTANTTVYAHWTYTGGGSGGGGGRTGSGGGGGGRDGGSTGPTTTSPTTTSPTTTSPTTLPTVAGSTVAPRTTTNSTTGVSSATVSSTEVAAALANAQKAATADSNPVVVINIPTPANTTSLETTIPAAAFSAIQGSKNTDLTVKAGDIVLTFGDEALSGIMGSGDVKMSVGIADKTNLNKSQQKAVGDRPVFYFSVIVDGNTVSEFGGAVTINVPYIPAVGENPNSIVIYYIDDTGNLKTVENCVYNPVTKTVTFTTTHFSLFMIGYNYVTFDDVQNHWSKAAIEFSSARGLVSGVGNGNYDPDRSITRAEFVQMMQAVLKLRLPVAANGTNVFTDVASDAWYYNAIMAANSAGLLKGVSTDGSNFKPNEPITREEMAVILANIASYKNLAMTNKTVDLKKFSDYSAIKNDYLDKLEIAIKLGLMSADGVGSGKFDPQSVTTRAQAAQVQKNLLSVLTVNNNK